MERGQVPKSISMTFPVAGIAAIYLRKGQSTCPFKQGTENVYDLFLVWI